jgi:hypothetical protein
LAAGAAKPLHLDERQVNFGLFLPNLTGSLREHFFRVGRR